MLKLDPLYNAEKDPLQTNASEMGGVTVLKGCPNILSLLVINTENDFDRFHASNNNN